MNKKTETKPISDDSIANTYVIKCMMFTCILFTFIWLLNKLNIFTVDPKIMDIGMLGAYIPFLVCLLTVKFISGLSSPATKYIILGFFTAMIANLNTTLTYHAVLTTTLPFICAVHYAEKKVVWYTYFLTAASIVISAVLGFRYGLCDANMIFLTNTYTSVHMQQISEGTIDLNDNLGLIILWWAFPRCLISVAYIPIMFHISNYIKTKAENELIARQNSEIDGMTGLFNKRKLINMSEESYHSCSRIAVIFWDANNLKKINDKIGHDKGDLLIKSVSDSIKMFTSDKCTAYRTGGDEFVMICSEPKPGQTEKIVSDWHNVIEAVPDICGVPVTAAVGFAEGIGSELDGIMRTAELNMYADKQRYH